jgi:hypothetical protein
LENNKNAKPADDGYGSYWFESKMDAIHASSVLVVRLKGATAFVINAILNLNALNLNAGIVVCVGVGVVVRIDAAKNEK